MPTKERQLQRRDNFNCECEACINDYPLKPYLRHSKIIMPRIVEERMAHPSQFGKRAKENLKIIGEHLERLDVYVASSDWTDTIQGFQTAVMLMYEKECVGFIKDTCEVPVAFDDMDDAPSE